MRQRQSSLITQQIQDSNIPTQIGSHSLSIDFDPGTALQIQTSQKIQQTVIACIREVKATACSLIETEKPIGVI